MTRNGTNSQGPSAGRKRRTENPPDFTGQLARAAVTIAIRGAQEYLRAHKLTADTDVLSECVKAHAKANVGAALDDAKEAFDCQMLDAGVATFTLTMVNAGIAAAIEASSPVSAMILRAKKVAAEEGTRMAVINDGLAASDETRLQYCPQEAIKILFPHIEEQKVLALIDPDGAVLKLEANIAEFIGGAK